MDYRREFEALTQRRKETHKGDYGSVAVFAGSESMLGAAQLLGFAALRMGSGLVTVFSVPEAREFIKKSPELMISPLLTENLNKESIKDACSSRHFDVIAIGPGLGLSDRSRLLVETVLDIAMSNNLPIIIDADALRIVDREKLRDLEANRVVLTPHPGEFRVLFPEYPCEQVSRRKEAAQAAAKYCRQIVVLKGAGTVIASESESVVNRTGGGLRCLQLVQGMY